MKQVNNKWKAIFAGVAATLAMSGVTQAQTSDALIDKLVDKGVLTVKEANALREEADKDFSKAFSVKTGMPDWVQSLKINGDLRLRYDAGFNESSNINGTPGATVAGPNGAFIQDRHRLRYRMRLGFTAVMSDQFEVGMRLASGDGAGGNADAISTNTTLDGNGSKKAVNIDMAYAKWTPREWVSLEAGKMNNQFWMSDMLFDGDYTPEGGQQKFAYNLNDKHSLSLASGQYVIDEVFDADGRAGAGGVGTANSSNKDVYLFINQLEWNAKWSANFNSRLALSSMNFHNQSHNTTAGNNNQGNALTLQTGPAIQPLIARAEMTYNLESFPLFDGPFPVTPSAELVKNFGSGVRGNQSHAYNLGLTLGSAKSKGNWQVSYNYKVIEQDAVWGAFTDSDFGLRNSGGTNLRGHVIKASYRLFNPLTVNFAYFMTENINTPAATTGRETQNRLIFDLVFAF